jgi:hypothetical protein
MRSAGAPARSATMRKWPTPAPRASAWPTFNPEACIRSRKGPRRCSPAAARGSRRRGAPTGGVERGPKGRDRHAQRLYCDDEGGHVPGRRRSSRRSVVWRPSGSRQLTVSSGLRTDAHLRVSKWQRLAEVDRNGPRSDQQMVVAGAGHRPGGRDEGRRGSGPRRRRRAYGLRSPFAQVGRTVGGGRGRACGGAASRECSPLRSGGTPTEQGTTRGGGEGARRTLAWSGDGAGSSPAPAC